MFLIKKKTCNTKNFYSGRNFSATSYRGKPLFIELVPSAYCLFSLYSVKANFHLTGYDRIGTKEDIP